MLREEAAILDNFFTLYKFNERLALSYRVDRISIIFLVAAVSLFLCAGIYSLYYMKDKEHLKRYWGFYVGVLCIISLMACSANLFTFYVNYELMTLLSAPLVMHEQTKEARLAGFKYLIYSFFGAYFVLFGFYVLNKYCVDLNFAEGGRLDMTLVSGHEGLILLAAFFMIIGFGVKAGMWPLHAWLTTAHPIAVSPASAVLSGVIVKAGVVGVIRAIFYIVGIDFVRGTWVQIVWIILILLTILMGSTLAYFEKELKKRLAYSTISQVSYILFGLAIFNETAYEGALLQFLAHAFAKCALFMIAGVFIILTGSKNVDSLRGIGKKYPILLWMFTICSLSMVGIPPTGGFMAKWYLILGSLDSNFYNFDWGGPAFLLISALLTAGYLFTIVMRGFLPGEDYKDDGKEAVKLPLTVYIPIGVLTILSVLVGIVPKFFVGGGM